LHTEQASSLRRDRLIQTRRRKVAAALRPQKTDKDSEEHEGWLKKFSFDTGYGFITPIKPNLGGRVRKQELFFHKSEWVGKPSLDRDSYRFPLRVRYTRAAPDDVRQRTRAVRVSATGPRRRTTVQVAAAIARRGARSAAAAASEPTVASATEETATAQARAAAATAAATATAATAATATAAATAATATAAATAAAATAATATADAAATATARRRQRGGSGSAAGRQRGGGGGQCFLRR
jgi:hypothetical protein